MQAQGVITAIEHHTVPNKARGMPDRRETRLRLEVDDVLDDAGMAVIDFPYDDFRADEPVMMDVAVGDRVRLVFAPSTGRRVTSATRLD